MIGLTGASGYLAKHLATNEYLKINRENIEYLDLSNIDTVYHLGGMSASGKNPLDYYENISYTHKLISKLNKKCKIVFTSTVKIHDSQNENPSDGYSMSKLICEKLIYLKHLQDNNNYYVFRMPNIVSEDISYGFLYELTNQIKTGHVKYVKRAYRPFIDIEDCIKAFSFDLPNGVHILGNNSILIEEVLDIASQYAIFEREELSVEPIRILADNSILQYGWKPKSSEQVLHNYFSKVFTAKTLR